MNLLFVSPITRAPFDAGPSGIVTITGVSFTQVQLDPDALKATAWFYPIEDGGGPGRSQLVTVSITGAMPMSQLLAAFKAAIAAKLNITFQ